MPREPACSDLGELALGHPHVQFHAVPGVNTDGTGGNGPSKIVRDHDNHEMNRPFSGPNRKTGAIVQHPDGSQHLCEPGDYTAVRAYMAAKRPQSTRATTSRSTQWVTKGVHTTNVRAHLDPVHA